MPVLTAAVGILLFATSLASAGPAGGGQGRPYAALLEEYRRGDREAAVKGLLGWTKPQLDELLEGSRRGRAAEGSADGDAAMAAVVMLHTEAALLGAPLEPHLELAESAMANLERRPAARTFRVSWRIVAASWLVAMGRAADAERLAYREPPDAQIKLLQGALAEASAQHDRRQRLVGSVAVTGSRRSDARVRWMEAEARYREALADDPTLMEARLRLGRVLALEGRADAALAALGQVRVGAEPGFLKYLAELFLGQIHERAGRTEAARECYEAASREYPEAQTAYVALGHLLEHTGQPAAGWAAVNRMFDGGATPRRDPWWVYPDAQFWQIDERLDALRAFARHQQ